MSNMNDKKPTRKPNYKYDGRYAYDTYNEVKQDYQKYDYQEYVFAQKRLIEISELSKAIWSKPKSNSER